MSSEFVMPVQREELLGAIRAVVKAGGGRRLDRKRFLAAAKLTKRDICRYYSTWNEALKAAGFDFDRFGERPVAERLLTDWGDVARMLQMAPRRIAYDIHGKYSAVTLRRRFGTWNNVGRAFEVFAAGKSEWADVIERMKEPVTRGRPGGDGGNQEMRKEGQEDMRSRKWVTGRQKRSGFAEGCTGTRLKDRPVCGDPLGLAAMRNEPMNEMGVVLLFGMLAERLGFYVESARAAFPDCEAKRRLGPGEWQTVRIEFEYESRNFREHGHDPSGCDLVVCWAHNWKECPVEVIALSDCVAQWEKQKAEN